MAATKNLTDYERKRLENIRRNEELMASLKLQSMATQLSSATKRPRAESNAVNSYNKHNKQPKKNLDPAEMRRSLRNRGLPPEKKPLGSSGKTLDPEVNTQKLGPVSMSDVSSGETDRGLIGSILGAGNEPHFVDDEKKSTNAFILVGGVSSGSSKGLEVEYLSLKEENVARVVPGSVVNVRFFPSTSLRMVVVGSYHGDVGFWNMESKDEDEDGIYVYRPHSGHVSGICVHQDCMSKVYTSCYDGFIRSMDAEKEVFDLVYASDDTVCSLGQQSDNSKCLYFAEGRGGISMWDERTGKIAAQWSPHDDRINSIDFNSENSNIIATSSTDGTACIWDLRCNDADKFKSLKTIEHKRVVNSAYFSPCGRSLLTTSLDCSLGISSGDNFDDFSLIPHDNKTSRWIPNFKAIWGWDDAYVFIGNKRRGVDVISPLQRRTVFTLESPNISAIPVRFAAHPYNVGMLAAGTGGGQVYVWTEG